MNNSLRYLLWDKGREKQDYFSLDNYVETDNVEYLQSNYYLKDEKIVLREELFI